MLVREVMTMDPVTVASDVSVPDALALMREKKVRRLPVLDAKKRLVGIVSDKDLLYASPSPSTSLNVWEIHSLLSKLTIDKVMTRDVVTIVEDTPVEQAARILAEKKIGGLPVMRGADLVGIITETDIFSAFTELLGERRHGVRIYATTSGEKGTVAKVAGAIFAAGGDIVGLATAEAKLGGVVRWTITVKVQDVPRDKLVAAVKGTVLEILDVRES
ncbi:MAG TPA: CBS domain-containing protein [Rectinemataceae bacterium]|nr:CBS domain-containing protein [Rectinemataceae bacterium]